MKTKHGVITSTRMTGTVTVTVHELVMHPLYKKRFRRSMKFLANPAGHDVVEGDTVLITECRPLSKRKYFRVTEVLVRVPRVSALQEEEGLEEAMHRRKEEKEQKEGKEKKDAPSHS